MGVEEAVMVKKSYLKEMWIILSFSKIKTKQKEKKVKNNIKSRV